MKKFACLLAIFISGKALSQDLDHAEHRDLAKNEISLNVFNVLIFGAIDISYERILSEQSSVGIEVFSKALNKNEGEEVDLSEVYSKEFSVTSKFKYYFKEDQTALGFYAEAFGMFSDGVNDKEVEYTNESGNTVSREVEVEYTDFALGFGVGGKFVSKKGFLIDLSFGLGRNMFNKDSPDLVVLPNINVGYRF